MHRFVHISSVRFHQSWGPWCGSVACAQCQWLDCFCLRLCFLRLAVVPRLVVSRFIGKALMCTHILWLMNYHFNYLKLNYMDVDRKKTLLWIMVIQRVVWWWIENTRMHFNLGHVIWNDSELRYCFWLCILGVVWIEPFFSDSTINTYWTEI